MIKTLAILENKGKSLKISQRISQIRLQFKLSKGALGEIAGISGTSIGNIESGETKNPGADVLGAISSKLGINLNWLVLGEGDMLKKPAPEQNSEPSLKNNSVSGAKADIDPRLLTGAITPPRAGAFNYPVKEAAPAPSPKQILGNMVEQLEANTKEIEALRAAVRNIQQQLNPSSH